MVPGADLHGLERVVEVGVSQLVEADGLRVIRRDRDEGNAPVLVCDVEFVEASLVRLRGGAVVAGEDDHQGLRGGEVGQGVRLAVDAWKREVRGLRTGGQRFDVGRDRRQGRREQQGQGRRQGAAHRRSSRGDSSGAFASNDAQYGPACRVRQDVRGGALPGRAARAYPEGYPTLLHSTAVRMPGPHDDVASSPPPRRACDPPPITPARSRGRPWPAAGGAADHA